MSQGNPIESLESRTLLASTIAEMQFPPEWPGGANSPGISRFGRTIYMKGTNVAENITISTTTRTITGLDVPANLLVEFRIPGVGAPVFFTGRIRRVLIDAAGGDDRVTVADNLPRTFHPEKIVIRGGDGNDELTGGTVPNVLVGEEGNDILTGRNARDILIGGNGNDRLTGAGGNDQFYGGAGDDTFINHETFAESSFGTRDILDGGLGGTDTAQFDTNDLRLNIENNNAS